MIEHRGELAGGKPHVQRDEHRVQSGRGEVRFKEPMAIGVEDRRAVAGADAFLPEGGRQVRRADCELTVRESAAAAAHGRVLRKETRGPLEYRIEVHGGIAWRAKRAP
jgi:hypothetical protein